MAIMGIDWTEKVGEIVPSDICPFWHAVCNLMLCVVYSIMLTKMYAAFTYLRGLAIGVAVVVHTA